MIGAANSFGFVHSNDLYAHLLLTFGGPLWEGLLCVLRVKGIGGRKGLTRGALILAGNLGCFKLMH